MPPSPDASGRAESHNARPLQLPYHNSSRHDTVPLAGRLDDGPDRKSSRDGSLSSTGDSNETNATSTSFLSAAPSAKHLDKGSTFHALPEDYDLDASLEDVDQVEMLERVSELLFSAQHLQAIFNEPACLLRFTAFLSTHRPQSVPNLIYYLDATKALKAIRYANAVATGLESVSVGELSTTSKKTTNLELETKAQAAFNFLAENDLPAYTAHLYIQVVKSSMMKPVAQDPQLPEASEGFAEVFCLTDPSRPDNPICFASEAFHQMTQYSMNYIIGRNCRFLQGPKTNPASLERIRNAVVNKQEHCEVILN
ncbi:hypothetical protein MMC19_002509 [Ptychographa xylographoides]|nr:hypothetical protein [Ptychographa xylographoides]